MRGGFWAIIRQCYNNVMVWYIYVLYVGSPIKYNRYIGYHTLGKYVYCTYLAQRWDLNLEREGASGQCPFTKLRHITRKRHITRRI